MQNNVHETIEISEEISACLNTNGIFSNNTLQWETTKPWHLWPSSKSSIFFI